jgi:putative endonuclease
MPLRRAGTVTHTVLAKVPVLRSNAIALRRARDTAMDRTFVVYILTNRPRGVLYVGVTNDLSRRLTEHRAKPVPGFTASHGLTRLVHVETYASILEARSREHSLKRWRRTWKFDLIEKDNPDWRDLADQILL